MPSFCTEYTANQIGFVPNSDFNKIWNRLYKDLYNYCQTQVNLYSSRSSMPIQLFRWMWNDIQHELNSVQADPNNVLSIYHTTSSTRVTDENIHEKFNSLDNVNENNTRSKFYIEIIHIARGQGLITRFQDKYKASALTNLATLLINDRYHKIQIFRGEYNKITIVTSQWNYPMWYKVFGLLPAFFPEIKNAIKKDSTAYNFMSACFNMHEDELTATLVKSMQNYEAASADRIFDRLTTVLKRKKDNYTRQLADKVETTRSSLNSALSVYTNLLNELDKLNMQYTGLLTTPWEPDPELFDFLKKSNTIKLLGVYDDGTTSVQFTTPVTNWREADAKMFFKHSSPNYFNNPEWYADTFKKIFIENKYKLIFTTVVKMPLFAGSNSWGVQTSPEGTYGNPHFTEFNCYASSRQAYLTAINNNDYVGGFSIMLAATASLALTDSAVMNRFTRATKEGDAHRRKILQDIETGEMLSFADTKERYNAEQGIEEPAF